MKRKRGQVKMRSEDGGFNSVVPNTSVKAPLNMNSSAINSTMSKTTRVNRIRRLASDNNTTESANPTPTNNEPKMSALKCLVSLAYPVSLPLQCTPFYFGFLFN